MPTRRNDSRLAVDGRAEHAPGAADRAEADENRNAVDRVAHLMVIADEMHRIRARFAADVDADDEPARFDGVAGRRRACDDVIRREEDAVGRHHEVRRVGDESRRPRAAGTASQRRQPGVVEHASRAPARISDAEDAAKQPAPFVQEVRDVDAAHALAVRQRHDEVDVRQLEQDEQPAVRRRKASSPIVLPEHVGRIRSP